MADANLDSKDKKYFKKSRHNGRKRSIKVSKIEEKVL